ncbi:insulinase family protein [Candidatus Parcubacteria bacterium]|nr:insulinase family protein [Candidatus Parcubacteria bacterium]
MWDPYAEFETEVLPNGLTVHCAHWPNRPWIRVGFQVHSGADQDPSDLEGLAHFTEHMVVANLVTGSDFVDKFFDRHGGEVTLGATAFPYIRYTCSLPNDPSTALNAFSILGNLLFTEEMSEGLEKERKIVLEEELRSRPQFPWEFDLIREVGRSLFNGHHRSRHLRPLGYAETISRFTQKDVQTYYDTHYVPANVSMVVVGGMNLRELVKIISTTPLAAEKPGKRNPLPEALDKAPSPLQSVYRVSRQEKLGVSDGKPTGSYTSFALLPGTMQYTAPLLYALMLRPLLFKRIREEKNLTYNVSVRCRNHTFLREIKIECDSFQHESADLIDDLVDKSIQDVVNDLDAFERQKTSMVKSYTLTDLNAKSLVSDSMDDLTYWGRIISSIEEMERRQSLTIENVREVVSLLEKNRRVTAIVLP